MRALKTIVIALGIALVAGFGLLVFGLTQNWHRLTDAATRPAADARAWGRVSLGQPPLTQIQSMVAAGDLVVVQIGRPSGEQQLFVLDPARGTVVGRFTVGEP